MICSSLWIDYGIYTVNVTKYLSFFFFNIPFLNIQPLKSHIRCLGKHQQRNSHYVLCVFAKCRKCFVRTVVERRYEFFLYATVIIYEDPVHVCASYVLAFPHESALTVCILQIEPETSKYNTTYCR